MIKWDSYFEKIFCIHYLPHQDRMKRLNNELKRVGILDSGILEWRYTVPDIYDDIIWKVAEKNKWCSRKSYVNLALENHRILKYSQLLGLRRILIIEDDIAFLKDLEEIDEILKEIPVDYGIVQFDKRSNFINGEKSIWEKMVSDNRINRYFVKSSYNFANATAMGYFNSGIDDAFNVLDKRLCTADRIVKFIGKPHAISIKSIAVQNLYNTAINLTFDKAENIHYKCYRQVGVEIGEYNVCNPE